MSQHVSPILKKLEASLNEQSSTLEHVKALQTLLVEKPTLAIRGAGNAVMWGLCVLNSNRTLPTPR